MNFSLFCIFLSHFCCWNAPQKSSGEHSKCAVCNLNTRTFQEMSENSESSDDSETDLDHADHSCLSMFASIDGTAVNQIITAEDLAVIPDSFPPFGCAISLHNKSYRTSTRTSATLTSTSSSSSAWMKCYSVIKGRYIFLTKNILNQTPIRAIPLDQITFFLSSANKRQRIPLSDLDILESDFSEFQIRVSGRRRAADGDVSGIMIDALSFPLFSFYFCINL